MAMAPRLPDGNVSRRQWAQHHNALAAVKEHAAASEAAHVLGILKWLRPWLYAPTPAPRTLLVLVTKKLTGHESRSAENLKLAQG